MTMADKDLQAINTSGIKPIGDPTWASDNQIIFLARSDSPSKQLYLADSAHPDAKPVLLDSPPAGESDARPDWSPEGLLFLRTTNSNEEGRLFIRHDLSSTGSSQPLEPQDSEGGFIDSAAWSPDESSIVIVRNDGQHNYTLWTMGADGEDPVNLDWPSDLGEPWAPAWGSR